MLLVNSKDRVRLKENLASGTRSSPSLPSAGERAGERRHNFSGSRNNRSKSFKQNLPQRGEGELRRILKKLARRHSNLRSPFDIAGNHPITSGVRITGDGQTFPPLPG